MVRACAGAMPVHTGRCWLLLVKRVWKYVKPSKGRRLCDAPPACGEPGLVGLTSHAGSG